MSRYRDLVTIVLVNLAALAGIVWMLRDPRASAVRVEPPPKPTAAPSATPVVLHVYVSGAVNRAGVVRLSEGARAGEAVDAAGGLSDAADANAVNLAAPLADGQQLHVPQVGDNTGPAPVVGTVAARTGEKTALGDASPRTDINAAEASVLEALPGIGPALAARIVAYRVEHGPFAAVDDLVAVPGIGERTLDRLRDLVIVR